MKIEFTTINELRDFINFVNEAKDEVVEQEVAQLSKTDKELKSTVEDNLKGDKTNGFTGSR